MSSYRFIGTYSTDSGNLWTWAGGSSSTSFLAAGTGGQSFGVSAFDMTPGTGATDVLNSGGSPYGTDMLNLSAAISANPSGFSVSGAPVFNWNGNPSTPGFAALTESLSGGVLTDTLNSAYWAEVRDYELSIGSGDNSSVNTINVTNFQNVDIKYAGTDGAMVSAFGVQRGTFDMSGANTGGTTHSLVGIDTAKTSGSTSQSTIVYRASATGDTLKIGGIAAPSSLATTAYTGAALVTDGTGTLVDIYDNDGGNVFDLTASNAASNLYLHANPGGNDQFHTSGGVTLGAGYGTGYLAPSSPTFISNDGGAAWMNAVQSAGGNVIDLSATGTGGSNINASSADGIEWINNFQVGRDSLTLDVSTAGFSLGTIQFAASNVGTNVTGIAFMNSAGTQGVILAGLSQTYVAGTGYVMPGGTLTNSGGAVHYG